jgi:nucleoside-diphosphate-sugar epimerase
MTVKKVLVTGSSGGIGQVTVRELLDKGYAVSGADLKPSGQVPTRITDMCDLGQVVGVMAGQDAVVHLAAIPNPTQHPLDVVFRTNVISTFNVLEAAVLLGIRKVVIASSLSALGYAYRYHDFSPHYLPVDDAHPLLSQDSYGLSKVVGEVLADGFARRMPDMSVTSLRFTLVNSDYEGNLMQRLRQNPDDSHSFWTYVDVRDAALACRLSVEYDAPGHEAFLITAPNSYMDEPTLDLFRRYCPGVERVAEGFGGTMSAVDSSRAARILGFEARYDWRGQPLR